MNKVEIIKNFNDIILNLLEQVSPMIGTKYSFYFSKIIKVNCVAPIKQFVQHGYKNKKEIMNKDESYFLNDTFASDSIKNANDPYTNEQTDFYLNEIIHLKQVYIQVDKTSKGNLWNILQALVLLCEEYIKLS